MDISDILERAAERLMEDESLRSNLNDEQATLVLNRALKWLEMQLVESEVLSAVSDSEQKVAQAVKAMRSVNARMKSAPSPDLFKVLQEALPLGSISPAQVDNPAPVQKASVIRGALDRFRTLWRRAMHRDKS